MRIDLCKKCGHDMRVCGRCHVCNAADEFVCSKCGTVADPQIHLRCIMTSLDYALLDAAAA